MPYCLLVTLGLLIGQTQIEMAFNMIRIQTQRVLEVDDRLVVAPLGEEDVARFLLSRRNEGLEVPAEGEGGI